MGQTTLEGHVILSKKCSYPNCLKPAVGTYRGRPLCREHLRMAEFIEWYIDRFME